MQAPPQIHHPRHLDAAYNLARWLTRSDAHAQEVVQQACLEAFGTFVPAQTEMAPARLMAIVRSACYARLQGTEDEPPIAREDDRRSRINDALQRLPIEFREVIVLREMEDLSYTAISSITGLTVGTVICRLGVARARLARHLEWRGS